MTGNAVRLIRFGAGLLGLVTVGWMLTGQAAQPAHEGLPNDWTHRHLIFSQPATAEQAARVAQDPRYWQQWYRQNFTRVLAADPAGSGDASPMNFGHLRARPGKVHPDWSEDLGNIAVPPVNAGIYPAKFQFGISNASCTDYVVFSTGQAGSAAQASVVAYNNLYVGGCAGAPSVTWAYNTGGTVLTSPVISGDGSQVAFVETNGGKGILVLLKWAASNTETVTSPLTLAAVANSAYPTCTAPCMTQIFLVTGSAVQIDDTTSSPFADYKHDTIWVGGAVGWLHKITGVFHGSPAEVKTGGFPVQVNPGSPNTLSSPIFDYGTGNVYVGDFGGFLYRVNGSTAAVTPSGQIDHGTGLVAGPVVDSTGSKVYVFSSSDGSSTCPGSNPCAGVFQLAASFGSGTTGAEIVTGASVAFPAMPNPMYEGALDGNYQASSSTGNLYVCGNTGGAPTLYQIAILIGVMQPAVAGPALSSATTGCSPVSDIPNVNATPNASEWIFASAQAGGTGNNCAAGGCVMNFVVKPWAASTLYAIGQQVLDTHFQVQTVRTGGTSRNVSQGHPVWSMTVGATTGDATVQWLNQGPLVVSYATWIASNPYVLGQEIVDSDGNIQIVILANNSKAGAHPVWNKNVFGITNEGAGLVRWRNLGAIGTASLAAAGGTGGIIIDNVVGSGTMAGASQVYFTTQSNQVCTGGTGGCAVQASQSALR